MHRSTSLRAAPPPGRGSEPADPLNGKSIGFIDNIKPNAGLFIQYIEEMMRADYAGIETRTVRKNFTSSKLIAHQLDGKVQALVNAWGD